MHAVDEGTENPCVGGSIPPLATKYNHLRHPQATRCRIKRVVSNIQWIVLLALALPAAAGPFVDGGGLERTELILRGPTQEARKIVYTMCRVDVYDVQAGEALEFNAAVHVTNDATYKGERLDAGFSTSLYRCDAGTCTRLNNLVVERGRTWAGGPDVTLGAHHNERYRWGKLEFIEHQPVVSVHFMGRAYSTRIKSGKEARLRLDDCMIVATRWPPP